MDMHAGRGRKRPFIAKGVKWPSIHHSDPSLMPFVKLWHSHVGLDGLILATR